MFCKNCGAQNSDDTRFCANCGCDLAPVNNVNNAGQFYNPGNMGYGAPGFGGAPASRPIVKRSIATAIILSIITCGIYGIIWFISLTDDTNYALGEPGTSGGSAFILTLITCGIYGFYWAYKQGEKLDKLALMKGQPASSRGVLYLILQIFGLGIIAYALMQDSLNKLAA